MKIWRFFKIPENMQDVNSDDPRSAYPMYACTQVKKIAKRFKQDRDMNKFIEKPIDVDSDTGEQYLVMHRAQLLSVNYIESIVHSENGDSEPVYVNCIYTESEAEYLREATDTDGILNVVPNFLPYDIFKSNIQEALFKVKYNKFVSFRREGYGNSADGFYQTGFQYDMFRTFMLIYGETFKPDYITRLEYMTSDQMTEDQWLNAERNA